MLGPAAACAFRLAEYVASGVTHIVARIGLLHADEGLAELADALLSGRVGEAHDDRATTS